MEAHNSGCLSLANIKNFSPEICYEILQENRVGISFIAMSYVGPRAAKGRLCSTI